MEHGAHGFTDWLSNLSVVNILGMVVVLTAIRIVTVKLVEIARKKMGKPAGVQLGRTTIEVADSLLYAFAVAFLLFKPLVAQPFYVPTGSMEPTLMGDRSHQDRVWVDKLGYRMHSPQRGDVVVFVPPANAIERMEAPASNGPTYFIKRLMAMGGDRIEMKAGSLTVNGVHYSHMDVRQALIRAGIFKTLDLTEMMAVDHVKFVPNGILADGRLIDKARIGELFTGKPNAEVLVRPGRVILNGKVLDEPYAAEDPDYDFKLIHGQCLKADNGLKSGYRLNGDWIGNRTYRKLSAMPAEPLPKGTYFMMGDNRNDSEDSTEWGPLKSKGIVGKAAAIFWPLNRATTAL